MNPEYEYIELVFENCNVVRIPAEYVLAVCCANIKKHIILNYAKQFLEFIDCENFNIELENKALTLETHFEDRFNSPGETFENHVKVFKDITHIFIKVSEDKEFYIGVPYKSKEDFGGKNELQENKFEEDRFSIHCTLDK